jgi:hypothetical protein
MIYVTGDTHGTIDSDKLTRFAAKKQGLSKDDFLIICGDFGGVWRDETEEQLAAFEKLPFTVLFADGNHEDYAQLKTWPVTRWKGGKVQIIRPGIIHLMRGQIYDIGGDTIFVFGGAESHDRFLRTPGLNWWREEVPGEDEIAEARKNLEKAEWNVDFVITHSCDEAALAALPVGEYKKDPRAENLILNEFERKIDYYHWYFGHYHVDYNVNRRKTALFDQIIPLGNDADETK